MIVSDHYRKLENMYHSAPVNQFYSPVLEVSEGRSVITMEVDPAFFHAADSLHGSVYFKALDDAAFFAANSQEHEFFVLTMSFNIYLLRPVTKGTLCAQGRVVSSTSRLVIAESELYVDGDTLVAHGTGSFMKSRVRLDQVESYR